MYYSLIEKHTDGSWWYHGDTFASHREAEKGLEMFVYWDKQRVKRIFAHKNPFPVLGEKTFCSRNLVIWADSYSRFSFNINNIEKGVMKC